MTSASTPELPKFYIVFSPDGPTPPVKMHPAHRAAKKAAWEMSERFPGQSFYVMKKSGAPAISAPCDSGGQPEAEDAKRLSGEAMPERPNEDSASPTLPPAILVEMERCK